jgi:hypothetical protein
MTPRLLRATFSAALFLVRMAKRSPSSLAFTSKPIAPLQLITPSTLWADGSFFSAPRVASIVVMVFLQVGYVVYNDSMLRADFFIQHLKPGLRRFIDVSNALAGMVLFGLMAYACVDPMLGALERGEFEGEGAMRIVT